MILAPVVVAKNINSAMGKDDRPIFLKKPFRKPPERLFQKEVFLLLGNEEKSPIFARL
jgi:hypothetical protein